MPKPGLTQRPPADVFTDSLVVDPSARAWTSILSRLTVHWSLVEGYSTDGQGALSGMKP